MRSVGAPDDLRERCVRPMAAPLVLPHLLDEILDVLLGGGARLLRPSRVASPRRARWRRRRRAPLGDRALQLLLDETRASRDRAAPKRAFAPRSASALASSASRARRRTSSFSAASRAVACSRSAAIRSARRATLAVRAAPPASPRSARSVADASRRSRSCASSALSFASRSRAAPRASVRPFCARSRSKRSTWRWRGLEPRSTRSSRACALPSKVVPHLQQRAPCSCAPPAASAATRRPRAARHVDCRAAGAVGHNETSPAVASFAMPPSCQPSAHTLYDVRPPPSTAAAEASWRSASSTRGIRPRPARVQRRRASGRRPPARRTRVSSRGSLPARRPRRRRRAAGRSGTRVAGVRLQRAHASQRAACHQEVAEALAFLRSSEPRRTHFTVCRGRLTTDEMKGQLLLAASLAGLAASLRPGCEPPRTGSRRAFTAALLAWPLAAEERPPQRCSSSCSPRRASTSRRLRPRRRLRGRPAARRTLHVSSSPRRPSSSRARRTMRNCALSGSPRTTRRWRIMRRRRSRSR